VTQKNWDARNPSFDIILTNPPFGTSESESLSDKDRDLYPIPSNKGQHLFLQRMVLATRPNGDICTVIDEGILNTDSARSLRAWLIEQCRIVAVVKLPDETFKPNKINVKSSVLYMRRRTKTDSKHCIDGDVAFCEVESLGYYGSGDSIRGYDLKNMLNTLTARIRGQLKNAHSEHWRAFDVPMSDLKSDPNIRLDFKYWEPAVRSRITELHKYPSAAYLGNIVVKDITRGKSPPADLYVDERDGYALVVKSGTNISKLGMLVEDGEDLDFIEKNIYDRLTSAHIHEGDVLLASTGDGTLGKCCVFRSRRPAIADGHVSIIRPDTLRVVPEYLCDYLRVGFGQDQIRRLFSGSTGMIELTVEHIKTILIDLLGNDLIAQKRASEQLRAGELAAASCQIDATTLHEAAVRQFASSEIALSRLARDVSEIVQMEAKKIAGVTAAFVRPDGCEFAIVGPDWTPELSEAGADVAVNIQRKLAPNGRPHIDGGYVDGVQHFENWIKVFP